VTPETAGVPETPSAPKGKRAKPTPYEEVVLLPICEDFVQDLTVTLALLQMRVFSGTKSGAGGFVDCVFAYLGDVHVVAEKGKVFIANRKLRPDGMSLWTFVREEPALGLLGPFSGLQLHKEVEEDDLLWQLRTPKGDSKPAIDLALCLRMLPTAPCLSSA